MEIVADILLVAGALGAALYCFVLSRRLRNFNDLEKGVGGAVAVLSAQVEDLKQTLALAQRESGGQAQVFSDLTQRAEATAQRLELMMASLHDLPLSTPPQEEEKAEKPVAVKPKPKGEPMFVRHPRTVEAAE